MLYEDPREDVARVGRVGVNVTRMPRGNYSRCCWRDSVKPIQFFCHSLPLSYLLDERQLTFFSKLQRTDNYVLRILAGLPMLKYEMLALAAKYSLNGVYCAVSTIKDLVLLSFAQKVQL